MSRSVSKLMFLGAASLFALAANARAAALDAPPDAPVETTKPAPARADAPTVAPVIVTAEKREQDIQKVPVAVSAFSADARDVLGITGQQDLANFTPGLSWLQSPERAVIRGVGRVVNSLGSDPGVSQYQDGIYNSEGQGLFVPYDFLARTEILRGPQGTLFGRNSIGGSINYISKTPTADLEADLYQTLANFNTVTTSMSVSGPISDEWQFRASLSRKDQGDGYWRNATGIPAGDNGTTWYGEAQLQFKPTDTFKAWMKLDYLQVNSVPYGTVLVDPYDTSSPPPNPTFGYTTPNPSVKNPYHINQNTPGFYHVTDSPQITVGLDWDLGWANLKYLGGYSQFRVKLQSDFDATSRAGYTTASGAFVSSQEIEEVAEPKKWWSNEIDLSSKDDTKLRWIVGLYEYGEKDNQSFSLTFPQQVELANPIDVLTGMPAQPNPNRNFYYQNGLQTANSYAVFGQIDYDLWKTWTVSAGLRYNDDSKNGDETQRIVSFIPDYGIALDVTAVALPPGITSNVRHLKNEWSGVSGHLDLQWKPDDETMAYGKVSRGYKSGGFNLGAFDNGVAPETLLAYELGLKKTLGRGLSIDADAYYYDFQHQQVIANFIVQGPCPGPSCIEGQHFINAPRADSLGLELESAWSPTRDLQLRLIYSYDASKYLKSFKVVDSNINCAPTAPLCNQFDLKGRPLVQTPNDKVTVNANYSWRFSPGDLSASASYSFTGKQYDQLYDQPGDLNPSYATTSFRLIWRDIQNRYSVMGYVDNAFDSHYFTQISTNQAGQRTVFMSYPRTFGVKLEYHFR